MEIIEKHPEKPWNWYWISRNRNLTMDFIEKYPEKPYIEININKISFYHLSGNEFTLENTRIKKKEGYMLLEKECRFHKLMNLYIIKNYM